MAAPDGEISVVFPNFRHFTFYRKFGGYTWTLAFFTTSLSLVKVSILLFLRQWAIMRKQYEDAGMSIEVIQAMYEYDWSVFNAARSYQNHTQEITAPSFEQGEESYSPLMNKYQEAISVTEHYRETKSRFTWIGEIENERLLTALETLKTEDLEIITMYAYEGYDITEISKVYGVSRPTISIKIKRITKFLKNFNFNATN